MVGVDNAQTSNVAREGSGEVPPPPRGVVGRLREVLALY